MDRRTSSWHRSAGRRHVWGPRVARRARLPAWPGRCGRQDGRAGAFGAIGRRILSCLRCKLADADRPLVQGPQRGQSRTPAAVVAVRLRRRDADSVRQGCSHPDIRIQRALLACCAKSQEAAASKAGTLAATRMNAGNTDVVPELSTKISTNSWDNSLPATVPRRGLIQAWRVPAQRPREVDAV